MNPTRVAAMRGTSRGGKRKRWPYVLAFLAALYIAYAVVMYFGQDAMIFPGMYRPHFPALGPTERGVEQVWLIAPDGCRVEAWYKPGDGCTPESPGPAVMYFHGNYDLVDTGWWVASHSCPAGLSTLVMEYRGYGRCAGHPSQTGIVGDAVRFYDWLAARPEVDRHRIVFYGTSLGGAVAAAAAAQRRPAALILECTFTSVEALAHRYALPGFLCRHQFHTDLLLPTLGVPVAIFHGKYDHTIPVSHGRRLHDLVPGSRYVELQCGHDDFHNDWQNVQSFLADRGVRTAP